jgi:hypothetical protein
LNVFPMPAAAMTHRLAASDWKWTEAKGVIGAADIEPPEPLNHLYRYLVASGFILPKEIADT